MYSIFKFSIHFYFMKTFFLMKDYDHSCFYSLFLPLSTVSHSPLVNVSLSPTLTSFRYSSLILSRPPPTSFILYISYIYFTNLIFLSKWRDFTDTNGLSSTANGINLTTSKRLLSLHSRFLKHATVKTLASEIITIKESQIPVLDIYSRLKYSLLSVV